MDCCSKSVLLFNEWHDPLFERMIAKYARERGWHLALDSLYEGIFPWGWQGDGCIAYLTTAEGLEFVKSLKAPVVDMNFAVKDPCIWQVNDDSQTMGQMAARYLMGLGFHNFAWYSTVSGPVSDLRYEGFSSELAKNGLASHKLSGSQNRVPKMARWQQRRKWLADQLKNLPLPCAVFCCDDRMSTALVEVALDVGLVIPDQLAVLGVGNLEAACTCSQIELSSIPTNYEGLCVEAVQLLADLMEGTDHSKDPLIVPPLPIIERRSTQTIATQNPDLTRAVRVILDRYAFPIGVDDIAHDAKVSRRQLQYLFSKELGIGPSQMLEKIRLGHAKKLLRETQLKLPEIAHESGFGTPLRLHRSFRKHLKQTPTEYRNIS